MVLWSKSCLIGNHITSPVSSLAERTTVYFVLLTNETSVVLTPVNQSMNTYTMCHTKTSYRIYKIKIMEGYIYTFSKGLFVWYVSKHINQESVYKNYVISGMKKKTLF